MISFGAMYNFVNFIDRENNKASLREDYPILKAALDEDSVKFEAMSPEQAVNEYAYRIESNTRNVLKIYKNTKKFGFIELVPSNNPDKTYKVIVLTDRGENFVEGRSGKIREFFIFWQETFTIIGAVLLAAILGNIEHIIKAIIYVWGKIF